MLLGKDFDLGDYPELLSWVQCNHEAQERAEKMDGSISPEQMGGQWEE